MARKKVSRLDRLLARFDIFHEQKLGHRSRTKLFVGTCKQTGFVSAIFIKKEDTVFRDGKTNNEAIEEGCRCWMMDESLLPAFEHKFGISVVYFFKEGTEDIWIGNFSDWLDPEKRYTPQHFNATVCKHSTEPLLYLSTEHMLHSPGRRSLLV